MKKLLIAAIIFGLLTECSPDKAKGKESVKEKEFVPHVEEFDKELHEVLNPDSKVEIIAEGFDWSEGPLWIDGLGLIFSDIPPNKIYLWNESNGTKLYLTPSGYTSSVPRSGEVGSNGLLLDHENNLILCQHGDRRMARMNADLKSPGPEYLTIVDQFQNKRLNSPNDACINRQGDLFFTDPPYGLEFRMEDPLKELDFQGVYQYSKDGVLKLLTKEMSRPNGIALTSDEQSLIVANSDPEKAIWMKFGLGDDGEIVSKEIFYDATALVGKERGLPDGLKIDSKGNIFATGPGGVWIFNAEGNVLGKVRTGQATSNCAIDTNQQWLYMTADMYVMRVKLK